MDAKALETVNTLIQQPLDRLTMLIVILVLVIVLVGVVVASRVAKGNCENKTKELENDAKLIDLVKDISAQSQMSELRLQNLEEVVSKQTRLLDALLSRTGHGVIADDQTHQKLDVIITKLDTLIERERVN